eukprot:CFRG0165T1
MFKAKTDVRRLMKKAAQDRKGSSQSSATRITDPLVKYTESGILTCVLCKLSVKSETVWPAHVRGRVHSQNIANLKNRKRAQQHPSKPPTQQNIETKPSISAPTPGSSSITHTFAVPALPVRTPISSAKVNPHASHTLVESSQLPVVPKVANKDTGFSVPAPVQAKSNGGFAIPLPVRSSSVPFVTTKDTSSHKRAFRSDAESLSAAEPSPTLSEIKKVKLSQTHNGLLPDVVANETETKAQLPADFFSSISNPTNETLPANFFDDGVVVQNSATQESVDCNSKNNLPTDFFDEPVQDTGNSLIKNNVDYSISEPSIADNEVRPAKQESISALPKGFFDDYERDTKERKIDKKKEMNDEWESFQKVMTKEQEKSEILIEEDEVEYAEGRDKDQLEEQRMALSRVEKLKELREQTQRNIRQKVHDVKEVILANTGTDSGTQDMNVDSDSSDDDLEDIDDWRSKAF